MKKTAYVFAALSFVCASAWAQPLKETKTEAKTENETKAEAKPEAKPDVKNELKVLSLTGLDSEGKTVKLSDYLGKTVLVSFITSGCNLCSRDLKLMREFYAGNAKKNFVLLTVNMDQNKRILTITIN